MRNKYRSQIKDRNRERIEEDMVCERNRKGRVKMKRKNVRWRRILLGCFLCLVVGNGRIQGAEKDPSFMKVCVYEEHECIEKCYAEETFEETEGAETKGIEEENFVGEDLEEVLQMQEDQSVQTEAREAQSEGDTEEVQTEAQEAQSEGDTEEAQTEMWEVQTEGDTEEAQTEIREVQTEGDMEETQTEGDAEESEETEMETALIMLASEDAGDATGYFLPDTGGMGVHLFTIGGFCFLAIPLLYQYKKFKVERRYKAMDS